MRVAGCRHFFMSVVKSLGRNIVEHFLRKRPTTPSATHSNVPGLHSVCGRACPCPFSGLRGSPPPLRGGAWKSSEGRVGRVARGPRRPRSGEWAEGGARENGRDDRGAMADEGAGGVVGERRRLGPRRAMGEISTTSGEAKEGSASTTARVNPEESARASADGGGEEERRRGDRATRDPGAGAAAGRAARGGGVR